MRRRPAAQAEEVRGRPPRRRYLRHRLKTEQESASMDMARSEVRQLTGDDYTTGKHLEHASQQARERNYQDFLIVDVDAHHYESESYKDVFQYIENPVTPPQALESPKRGQRPSMRGGTVGYQDISGRIPRHDLRRHD